MNYVEEAIGIAKAAQANRIPVVISFTVETDGRLASGDTLQAEIELVERTTAVAPAYYMVNCAHPTHFNEVLSGGASWINRVRGIRANASTKSHAELDVATELDAGNPKELGEQYRELRRRLPQLSVLGDVAAQTIDTLQRSATPVSRGNRWAGPLTTPSEMGQSRRCDPGCLVYRRVQT